MGQCCSNEDSRRQRAADFARAAAGGDHRMGAAESPLKAAVRAAAGGGHPAEQRQHVFRITSPRRSGQRGSSNSIFGFVEATDRVLSDEEDEDDPGEDDEEETIEFYSSRSAAKPGAVDHHRLVSPSRRERKSSSSSSGRGGGGALSKERKRQIERMIIEEGGDNAAVLRRILAEQQQDRGAPLSEPQQPVQQKQQPNSTKNVPNKKKKKFFGFRNKKKNKSESTAGAATEAAPNIEESLLCSTLMESVQTTVIREDRPDDAPSDEESLRSPSIPRGIVKRRTNKFTSSTTTTSSAAIASPGRLAPIKLKTQSTASPESIKIHHSSSSSSAKNEGSKNSLQTPATASHNRAPKKVKTPGSTASLGENQYSDFQKLQLKVAVAKKQAQKQHKVAKLEDRLKDVQGYNQLWQNFEKIQQTVVRNQTTTTPATETNSSTADTPVTTVSVAADDNGSSPSPVASASAAETAVASPPSSEKQDAPESPPEGDAVVVVEYDLEEEEVVLPEQSQQQQQPPIEYDLAEDLGFKKGGGSMASSIRSFTSRGSRKSSKSNGSSTGGGGGRRRRRFRRRNRKIEKEDDVVVPSKDDSFKLKETETWYFDFQDEFENEDAPKGGDEAGTTGSNNSQASLSLLSQSSLEAQRRFFSEKRRQRKLKERQAALPPTVPATPSGKNDPITGYGLEPVDKANAVASVGMEFDLAETPIAGNKRRNSSSNAKRSGAAASAVDYQRMSTAQQLLACKDNPALRQQIANNILRSRTLTNMEVITFSSPESGTGDDDDSMVSDLDDNVSVTSVSGYISSGSRNDYGYRRRTSTSIDSVTSFNSSRCRNDYGVSRRRRPSMASQSSIDGGSRAGGGDGDQSTVAAASKTSDSVSAIGSSAYDHEIVLKRRLEIEAKLRALQAEDDDDVNPSGGPAELSDTSQVFPNVSPADNIHARPRSPSGDGQDDYVLPAALSPQDVRSQRRRGKAPGTVYPAVACEYLASPMYNGKLCSSSPDAKTVESNSPVSNSQNVSPEQSQSKSKEQEVNSSKLNESFESEISSRSRITMPYLRAASANSSKRTTTTMTGQDDNDSLVATQSTASVSRSVTPSSGSGKESTHPHVIYENETPTSGNSKGSLSGARDTLLLADQVEARVKDVLHRYRSGPDVTTSVEEDDQPPRIVSPRASWIR